MAPRLRPEVILPLRTSSAWARTLLLSCCAFIMFVTTIDALRYASQREARPRPAAVAHPAARPDVARFLRDVEREADAAARRLEKLRRELATTSPSSPGSR